MDIDKSLYLQIYNILMFHTKVKESNLIIVEPKKDFWTLEGSLASEVKLSDNELRQARESFSKNWPKGGGAKNNNSSIVSFDKQLSKQAKID